MLKVSSSFLGKLQLAVERQSRQSQQHEKQIIKLWGLFHFKCGKSVYRKEQYQCYYKQQTFD